MKEMVEKFQCPGCVNGMDTNCGEYNFSQSDLKCISHVLGTSIGIGNHIALGLPKGFNKAGVGSNKNIMNIELFKSINDHRGFNHLNVPVWALEKDGYLFVREYLPRIDYSKVDIIKGGTLKDVPSAINVAEFYDDID